MRKSRDHLQVIRELVNHHASNIHGNSHDTANQADIKRGSILVKPEDENVVMKRIENIQRKK